jgi:hypothetical protein
MMKADAVLCRLVVFAVHRSKSGHIIDLAGGPLGDIAALLMRKE